MKKLLLVFSILYFLIPDGKAQYTMNLTGKVWNPNNINFMYISPMVRGVKQDTIWLTTDGSFKYTLEIQAPTYFKLIHGNNSLILFLGPGYNVTVNLNDYWFYKGDVTSTGLGSNYSTFLIKQHTFNLQIEQFYRQKIYQLPYKRFFNSIDSVLNKRINELNAFTQSIENPDQNFIAVQQARYTYTKAELMLTYVLQPRNLVGQDSINFANYYNDFFSKLPLNQSSLVLFDEYYNFLVRYVDNSTRRTLQMKPELMQRLGGPFWATFDVIKSLDLDQSIKDFMYYKTIEPLLQKGNISDVVELLPKFGDYCSDASLNANVSAYYNYWLLPNVGSTVPEITFNDVKGEKVKLSDFKGKYVMIDVWATWCGPCKKEIPKYAELIEKMKDKNIAFLSVSTDQKLENWTKYESEHEMHGIQLHTGSENEISKFFKVNSIPRFIVLDKEGKVLNPRAPRPSNQATYYYLMGLEGM